ncbi:hypothetical protein [Lactococcus lactis]|uniref:hypothetical protein n=1 Tax=Lactococcus lactis TaxID=1358 RepID=UPI0018AB3079|nr:hypothetical protein [Lactococcus lactis]QQE99196.1 hypothetical protein LacL0098_06635 [Lactococcus lactis]
MVSYCGKTKDELLDELFTIESELFYNSYIKSNEIWYFNRLFGNNKSAEQYYSEISDIVCQSFKIATNNFLIVGSAKLGFSLSPIKKFKSFNSDGNDYTQSDIDIAIISPELFKDSWQKLKDLKYITFINNYPGISSNIFRGFVNDKNIFEQISLKLELLDMIDNCARDIRDEFGVIEPINFRIYDSWDDLKKYTIDGIVKCKENKNGI